MADHAPDSRGATERLMHWFAEMPDTHLSLCMLLLAIFIGIGLFFIDVSVF